MLGFWRLIKGFRIEFVILIFANTFLYSVEAIVHPLLVKSLFDEAIIKGNFKLFVIISLLYLILALLLISLGHILSLWQKKLENRITEKVSSDMLANYYKKDYSYILSKGEGFFISRIYNDMNEGVIPLIDSTIFIISRSFQFLSFLCVMLYISWAATLALAIVIPPVMYISSRIALKIEETSKIERASEGVFMDVLVKSLKSFKVVYIFNLLSKLLKVYRDTLRKFLKDSYDVHKSLQMFLSINDLLMNINTSVSMVIAGYFVFIGKITFGGYLAFVNTFWRSVSSIMDITSKFGEMKRYTAVISKLREFEDEGLHRPLPLKDNITLQNVEFSYGNGYKVFEDLSLNINPREKVLIVGPNGSGKTTLANLISGFLRPTKGDIYIHSRRISSITLPYEFPPIKIKEMIKDEKLLRDLGIYEFKDKYPYELSSGQRQRLAIALTLSKDADIYIFDEPLANIDKESKEGIMNLILDRTENSTLIVIMHNADGFKENFDRIIELKKEVRV